MFEFLGPIRVHAHVVDRIAVEKEAAVGVHPVAPESQRFAKIPDADGPTARWTVGRENGPKVRVFAIIQSVNGFPVLPRGEEIAVGGGFVPVAIARLHYP